MRLLHRVKINVFSRPEDNLEEVEKGLVDLVGLDLEEEKIRIDKKRAEGFNERQINILTIILTKIKHIRAVMEKLLGNLSEEQKKLLLSQVESRLDENCNFFLRIEKDKWTKKQEVWLTDGGDCYHIKLTIAAYPKNRENAKKIVEKVLAEKSI